MTSILRYAAFSDDPKGGNPAGVVLDASSLDDERMLAIAAEVGYSETAFITGTDGGRHRVRYFSPLAEVPFRGHAGANHPVLAAASRRRLAGLAYDVPALKALMEARGWTTVQLVFRTAPDAFDVRDPFPVGGVYEDPATGAAAAAFGAYLRDGHLVPADATVHLSQGADLGRPSRLTVELRTGEPGVRVSGTAVPIDR